MTRPLLTIAIPTYNRSGLLDICVNSICNQIGSNKDLVEIIISNNASTDNTEEVVQDLIRKFLQIKYFENEKNGGPDLNIAKCFDLATAKYIWIFSDDDTMLPNALTDIIQLLYGQEFGVVFLKPIFYRQFIGQYIYKPEPFKFEIFTDSLELLRKVHFWTTFITGTITNKDVVTGNKNLSHLQNSFLVQLSWVLPALFNAKQNVYVSSELILGRIAGVQDYRIFHVFATSYPKVLKGLVAGGAMPAQARHIMIDLIMEIYFRHHLDISYKYQHGERPLIILGKAFWNRRKFWTVIIPLLFQRQLTLTNKSLRRPYNFILDKVLKKMYRRGEGVVRRARNESIVKQLKRFGDFSKLPAEYTLTNPQYIDIGHEFEAEPVLTLNVRIQDTTEAKTPSLIIGNRVRIGRDFYLDCGTGINIGDLVSIGNRVTIIDNEPSEDSEDIFHRAPLYRKRKSQGAIQIGNKVLIEDDARILPGVTIGDNAIIKAKSVVASNVPPNSIISGNPAEIIG